MNDIAIVVNKYLKNEKFMEIQDLLQKEIIKNSLSFAIYNNDELINVNKRIAKLILFLDKDIKLAKRLELSGNILINSSSAIEISDDKYLSYLLLLENNIKTPRTVNAPFTFKNIGYNGDFSFLKDIEQNLKYPIVVKESKGSFGEQVHIVFNYEELLNITKKYALSDLIFQEFINTTELNIEKISDKKNFKNAKDIRIEIIAGECVAAMQRVAQDGDFRANATLGAKIIKYNPTLEEISLAKDTARIFNLEIAGIDILNSTSGELFVCEVNSNAHFKLISQTCNVNVAEKIIRFCKERLEYV